MPPISLPPALQNALRAYRFEKDSVGMSPGRVYKLLGRGENLYLKISDSRFDGTTYDVEREKNLLLWLKGTLPVPEVLAFERHDDKHYLLMTEADGLTADLDYARQPDPLRMVRLYAEGIAMLQPVPLADCPYDNSIENRLSELGYLLERGLADVDGANWEDDTPFTSPSALYAYLQENRPAGELVFSHGDFCDNNFFVRDGRISALIDLGRAGRADKWQDIALCVRAIRRDLGREYLHPFFEQLEVTPDWDKINYYILLDEMF